MSFVKRILSLILALAMVIGLLPVTARAGELENGLVYEVYADHVEITGYTGEATEVVIPAKIKRIPVTVIGENAFSGCSGLTDIVIPDSVTSIGENAFSSCSSLTSIDLPDGITAIGNGIFSGCSNLTSIEIPGSVTSIGEYAFHGCSGLRYIEIPDSVTYIGGAAFFECSGLTGIDLPDSITSINNGLFSECTSLTDIEIPDGVTQIGYHSFRKCYSLTSIDLPESITVINGDAFWYCNNLASIDLPDSLTYIGESAFSYCTSLTSIDFPDSVTYIGECAFFNCISLTSIEIPESVTYIGSDAFDYCEGLSGIHVDENNPFYSSDDRGVLFDKAKTVLIRVPGGIEGTYTVPDSVTRIGYAAFRTCYNLTGVELPDDVTSIDAFAFYKCNNLTSINLPLGITCIDAGTFSSCTLLPTIEIPCSVTYIGSSAFNHCSNLRSIYFTGDAPVFDGNTIFYDVSTTAYYPEDNATWTSDVKQHYFGYISWIPYDAPEHTHEYTSTVHTPTCTRTGLTVYTCICGDRYAADHVDPLGHDYADGVCAHCGKEETDDQEPVRPSDPSNYMFTSEDNLTRGMITYALWNYFGAPEPYFITQPFVDVSESDYYHDAVYWAVENGIMSGTNPSIFGPDNPVNRCQAATFLWRAFDSPEPSSDGIPFTDVREGAFYTDAVCWAAEEGYMRPMSETKFDINEPCQYSHFDWTPDGPVEEAPGLRYLNQGDSIIVIGYTGEVTDLVIPSEINGLPVTGIRERAFLECSSLTSIVIPDTITSIGEYTFYDCTSLTSIDLPDSITSIGYYAFGGCESLTGISIPERVTFIDAGAFSGCSSLTEIDIPDRVTRIETWTFAHCTGLTSITLPDTLTYIGDLAIYNCAGLTDLEIPDSVTYIGNQAFGLSSGLSDIEIPESVTYIGKDAFYYCSSLTGIHVDEDNLYYSSDDRGVLFDKAKTVLIKAPVTISGTYTVPDSVTFLNDDAFYNCADLTGIAFPADLITIGKYAFDNCANLTGIEIPGGVTYIGDGAFRSCSSLTDIEIPSGVTCIGEHTFNNCGSLTSIKIPDDVTSIGDWAFSSCSSLTSVTIPDGVTSISDWAFYGCSSLTSIKIPDGVTSIGYHAFCSCESLASISIPESVTYINYGAFSSCANLTSIYFSGNAPVMESSTFLRVTATAYYPADNPTWTADVMQNYQGQITWVPYSSKPFADVPAGAYYEAPVLWAVENGITSGASENSFNPGGSCLRAQVVTFLWRAAKQPEPAISTSAFTDVRSSDFFFKPVLWAVEQKITSGVSATEFGSYANCNRAAVVTFLWRAAGSPEPSSTNNPFTDVKSTDFFYKPVLWAVENGITAGLTATTFGPTAECNRAQVVTFLYRAYN